MCMSGCMVSGWFIALPPGRDRRAGGMVERPQSHQLSVGAHNSIYRGEKKTITPIHFWPFIGVINSIYH